MQVFRGLFLKSCKILTLFIVFFLYFIELNEIFLGGLKKRTQLNKLLEPNADALVRKAIEMALSGDSVALRLCIERLLPRAEQKQATAVMPDLKTTETTDFTLEIMCSLAGQEITVSDIKYLLGILHLQNTKKPLSPQPTLKGVICPIEASKIYQEIMLGNSHKN